MSTIDEARWLADEEMKRDALERDAEPDNPEVMGPLKVLIQRARTERKWLYCGSFLAGPLWFSPDELEAHNLRGRYRWSAENWALRDPMEYLDIMTSQAREAADKLDDVIRRIATWAQV